MPVRRTRHALAATSAAGFIGLAAEGCSGSGPSPASAAAAVAVVPADHADVLGTLPAAVDGTKIVVASFLDARRFSKALRDAGV